MGFSDILGAMAYSAFKGTGQKPAAQVCTDSLLASEVDTPAERQYMQQLAYGLGLPSEVVANLEKTVGLAAP